MTATDLADLLVRRGAMDFRTAHHVAGAVVRMLMDCGLGAHEATLEMVEAATQQEAGRASGLTATEVAEALDLVRSVASRQVTGGPAPAEVRRMAAVMTAVLEDDEAMAAGWRAKLAVAAAARTNKLLCMTRDTS